MSRYRAVHCLIWNDDKFPFASDDCQLVFFHLITTPLSTPFGCYKASLEALAAEKRWPLARYTKAFQEAFGEGFVKYDERHLLILLPNFLKYNPPTNPNVLQAWGKLYDELPDSPLKVECYQRVKGFAEAFGKGFAEAFAKGWRKHSRIQEQDQEQDQEQEQHHNTAAQPTTAAPPEGFPLEEEEITPKPHRRVGTRLPDDWQPTAEDLAWARGKGYDRVLDLDDVTEAFRYYWQSTTKNSTKLDWSKTWRNRVRDEAGGHVPRRLAPARPLNALPARHDPELDALVAKKIAEEEEEARHAGERAARVQAGNAGVS